MTSSTHSLHRASPTPATIKFASIDDDDDDAESDDSDDQGASSSSLSSFGVVDPNVPFSTKRAPLHREEANERAPNLSSIDI